LRVRIILVAAAFFCGLTLAQAADREINVILPLTGGASFLGKAEQIALQLAEKLVNENGGIQGRPLHLVIQDDQSSPQLAVQLASQVIARHPAVLIGSSLVAMCNAMAPLMTSGPVMYCMSPGIHPAKDSYVFTSSVSTPEEVTVTDVAASFASGLCTTFSCSTPPPGGGGGGVVSVVVVPVFAASALTVSVAGLVGSDPWPLVNTASYFVPLSAGLVAGVVYVPEVAPVIAE